MRLRTLLMTTSLVLVALSLPPASAAPEAPGCQPTSFHAETVLGGLYVAVDEDCRPTVNGPGADLLPLLCPDDIGGPGLGVAFEDPCTPRPTASVSNECLGGSGNRKVLYDDGYVHVSHTHCDSGLPPVSSTSSAPGCPPRTIEWEGPFGTNRVEQEHNCRTTTTLNEGIICLGGSVDRDEYSVEGHTVIVYSCGNPDQGGVSDAALACDPWGFHAETVLGGVYVGIDENCRPDVRNNGGPAVTTSAPGCEPAGTHAETPLGGVYVGVDESCRPDVRHNLPLATASAAPGCPPRDESTGHGLGSVRVEQEHNCRVDVTVNEGIDCVGAYTRSVSRDVSGNTVTVYYCAPPRAETTSAAAPSCQKVPSLGVVSVSDDCYTVSIKLYDCFWGGYWNERSVGPVTVRDYRCGPPPSTSTAQAAPDCGPLTVVGVGGLNTLQVRDDCTAEVGVLDGANCVGGWGTRVDQDVAGNTVRVLVCDGGLGQRLGDLITVEPTTTSIQDPFPTCVREPCGPELPGPRAPCSDLQGQGGFGVTYTLDAGCNLDVQVKLYECVWNGYWRTVGAGPVSVSVYQCSGPETTQTAANPFPTCVTEPCGPSVPDPCTKLQAIGYNDGLNTLSFRSDCTFELGVMDGATCVGGWGQTTERDVAGNTVRVTVCDGGLGNRLGDIVKPTSTASAPFRCAYVYEDVHGPLGTSSVEGEHTCWFNVVVSEGVHCTGGDAERTERQVLNVNVVAYTCDGPDADATASTGGPCDRIHGPIQTQELTWTIDDDCRHDIYVDVIECPNQSQWTKTNEQYEAHPNLTLHYTFCRLG